MNGMENVMPRNNVETENAGKTAQKIAARTFAERLEICETQHHAWPGDIRARMNFLRPDVMAGSPRRSPSTSSERPPLPANDLPTSKTIMTYFGLSRDDVSRLRSFLSSLPRYYYSLSYVNSHQGQQEGKPFS
eukprot:TRINITY_DN1999_c0_g1_i11.p1 TRINITY_DN1999_c0_g1~~TRINITY_DN1999_c0_g1_i11.p1  ORF type:complete len:133 (+),score=21.56 TRINITY_DN1999_c0_g1_i11:580-978(+)